MGAVIRASLTGAASATQEESQCDDKKQCAALEASGSIPLFGGVTVFLEVTSVYCGFSERPEDCNDVVTLSGRTDVGIKANGGFRVLGYLGENCEEGCTGFYINETKFVANVSAKIIVGGIYSGSYNFGKEVKLWDKIGGGSCGL